MSLKIKNKYRVLNFRWNFFFLGGGELKLMFNVDPVQNPELEILFCVFRDFFVKVYEINVLSKDDGHQSISTLDFRN